MSRNRNLRSLLFALLALGLIAPAAQATVILDENDDTIALGIEDLAYDGTVYDITFVAATPGSIYGAPPNLDLDFDDSNAVGEVIALMNAELSMSTAQTVEDSFAAEYRIAFDYNLLDGTFDTWGGEYGGTSWNTAQQRIGTPPDAGNDVYAVFTVVPEPGTALLMGLGLAGLAAGGRSRRRATHGTA